MSKIKSKNTKPEVSIRKQLWHLGYRYRIHYPISGKSKVVKPDICFPQKKIAIFIDGCFWHACPTCYKEPKSNVEFWRKKIQRNRARDLEDIENLKNLGWRVLRIWEHEIKKSSEGVINMILDEINVEAVAEREQ